MAKNGGPSAQTRYEAAADLWIPATYKSIAREHLTIRWSTMKCRQHFESTSRQFAAKVVIASSRIWNL